jgi:O-antigen ligase
MSRPELRAAARLRRRLSGARLNGTFWALMVFTFVLFVSPQFRVPALQALRPAFLSAAVAVGLYVLDRFAYGGRLSTTLPPFSLLLVFTGLAAASIPTSLWPGGSYNLLTNQLAKSMAIGLLIANTIDSPKRMKIFVGSLICWGIVMATTAVREYSSGDLALDGTRIAGYDSPLAANPNDLALTLNLIIALAIGILFATRSRGERLVILGAIALMVGGVVASFSRGGFITLVGLGLVLLWRRARARDVSTVAAVLLAVSVSVALFPSGYGNRLYSILDFSADKKGSADARWEGMWIGVDLIKERPLTGYGLGANGLEFVNRGHGWTGLHNAFLQVGADVGLPALVVFVVIVWQLFRGVRTAERRFRRLRAKQHEAFAFGIYLSLVVYTVAAQFHPIAYHFYLFYIAGLALALQGMVPQPRERSVTGHKDSSVPLWVRGRGITGISAHGGTGAQVPS